MCVCVRACGCVSVTAAATGCNINVVFMLAFSKLKAARVVATEMSCLCLRLES